jgi:predicted transposase/invertase (TIGR01784 family)
LFQTLPQFFFDLIERPSADAAQYRFESVELKQTAFRIDGVVLPPADHPDWPVFFVEVQFQPDPDLYARLFAEVFLYLRQQRPSHPWQAVVLYPTRAGDPGEHLHYQVLLRSEHVTQVYLDEWARPRQTLTQQVVGVLLAAPPQAIVEAKTVLSQVRGQETIDSALTTTIVNLVETILGYKLPTLSREEIQAMLELTDIDLKQTRFYREVFTEGRQEGRQEEGIALILRQLQKRCGTLGSPATAQVTRLSLLQLEALGEALLEFRGLADLEQWLAIQARE